MLACQAGGQGSISCLGVLYISDAFSLVWVFNSRYLWNSTQISIIYTLSNVSSLEACHSKIQSELNNCNGDPVENAE